MTEQQLTNIFEGSGEIEKVILPVDHTTGSGRGFGFVVFKDPAAIIEAQ